VLVNKEADRTLSHRQLNIFDLFDGGASGSASD